ncbi:MAG: 50S ribosomal protein L19 [Candidatus Wallbacteria bacterium]|nr:50S ribosomal protein L19 [Candidatus Wallbacteria bacterium]
MSDKLKMVEKEFIKADIPNFKPGDRVKVNVKVKEGDKERIQPFEGDVIACRGEGINASYTVRKVSYGTGVERTFLLHSPRIQSIEIKRSGVVRRAKLFYLRGLSAKKARIKEKKFS